MRPGAAQRTTYASIQRAIIESHRQTSARPVKQEKTCYVLLHDLGSLGFFSLCSCVASHERPDIHIIPATPSLSREVFSVFVTTGLLTICVHGSRSYGQQNI